MLKNLIILPDGTELTAGTGQTNNIRTVTLTECVNSGEELALGSVCAAMMEATVQASRGALSLDAGEEVILYKLDDNTGTRHKVGPFTLEKPTRASANILKLTGYDRVVKLDKDLTAWLNSLTGWPYTLLTFAGMVCKICGLTLATSSIPNGDYLVQKITKEATGRQLMQWIGEVCCRFCRANADGEIELAWYTPSGISITPSGEHYFFQRGLTYEDYQVAPIDAVQIRLADSEDGALWPAADEGANNYVIAGNPILIASITEDTLTAIQTIRSELAGVSYTPCKVAIPATFGIRAGNTVQITDANGVTITTYVMTKTQKGQRDTLESTGSPRRDSTTALNNKTDREKTAAAETYADNAAKQAVSAQTQFDIFNKLTNNGAAEGIFLKDGQLYINVNYLAAGILASADGKIQIDLGSDGNIPVFNTGISTNGLIVRGDEANAKSLFTATALKGAYGDYYYGDVNFFSADGPAILHITEAFNADYSEKVGVTMALYNKSRNKAIDFSVVEDIAGIWLRNNGVNSGFLGQMSDGASALIINQINGKTVSWKDNGDGTYTLIGS